VREAPVGDDSDLTGPRSDQGYDFLLRLLIALDVQRGRSQARMTGELLDVSEAPADLAVFSGGTSDESPATAVA
jgi:hypothetical protein